MSNSPMEYGARCSVVIAHLCTCNYEVAFAQTGFTVAPVCHKNVSACIISINSFVYSLGVCVCFFFKEHAEIVCVFSIW